VLAFLHVRTRRVFLTPASFAPDRQWMVEQAGAFLAHARQEQLPVGKVLRDRDGKFGPAFDAALAAGGAEAHDVCFRSPNMNAYVERFGQAIRQECLDRPVAFGREHLDVACGEYAAHYHRERPHQAVGNAPLMSAAPPSADDVAGPAAGCEVVCRERLGGLLRHYVRAAAA
jgi:putative transposase